MCDSEGAAIHEPVLLTAVMELVAFAEDAIVVDATLGQAGHAEALAQRLGPEGVLIGLDVDDNAQRAVAAKLAPLACRVEWVQENFGLLEDVLNELDVPAVDVILADLGVSSAQLADAECGISFQVDGPLDMRLDRRLTTTAADIVNRYGQEDLANTIYRYGEEWRSRAIARAIVAARKEKPIQSTGELVEIVCRALRTPARGRRSKIHPATRTFQALRIAVNDELGQLERLLEAGPRLLKPGGFMAVISFHSLEDRMVKHTFRRLKEEGLMEIITRKCVTADDAERSRNPRSRSAKLRVARRITG